MFTVLTLILAVMCASCESYEEPFDLVQFESDNLDWREGRLERLKGPTGYLNLVGLYWLADGTTTIGSAEGSGGSAWERPKPMPIATVSTPMV